MKIYRSRIGWELWGPTIFLFAFIIYKSHAVWPVMLLVLMLGWFFVAMVLKMRYVISDDKLFVKAWPIMNLEIDIRSIHRISRTWNPLSSPAASYFGRIEVHYDNGKSCIISPRDKDRFIGDLLDRNKYILTFEVK